MLSNVFIGEKMRALALGLTWIGVIPQHSSTEWAWHETKMSAALH